MCINCGDGSPGYDAPRWKFELWERETEAVESLRKEEIFYEPDEDIYHLQSILRHLEKLGWTIRSPLKGPDKNE